MGRNKRIFEERKQAFLHAFSLEAQDIRDSIVEDIVDLNEIISIRSETFEEASLRLIAEQRNIPYDRENPPLPECPHCRTEAKVHKKEDEIYICRLCGKTFSASYNSIASGSKVDSLTWMKFTRCFLSLYSIKKTCDYCNITETTYYRLRNKLVYAMGIMLSDVRLYGKIEVDITYTRSNFKGLDLSLTDYPEDSPFYDDSYKPRPGKKRGGSFSVVDKNANQIAIYTMIDEFGHVAAYFVGCGAISHNSLLHYVPTDKYLMTVPEKDPFPLSKKKIDEDMEKRSKAGTPSLMIADKERALKKYAAEIGIPFDAHVYRKKGQQLRLPNTGNHIQHVNALHSRLKTFLRNTGWVSSKYLPAYLTLFCFLENCGNTRESIAELFRVLSTPNLGRSAKFYEEQFSVPNYLVEWFENSGTDPLKKIPSSKMLAFYLYDQIRHKEDYPDAKIPTMADIEAETGYRAPTIRKSYRELEKAGYRDLILNYFNLKIKKSKEKNDEKLEKMKGPKLKRIVYSPKTFNPVVLAMYDEYAEERKKPSRERRVFEVFVKEINAKYGTDYKASNLRMKFKEIVNKGVRPELDKIGTGKRLPPHQKYFDITDEYDQILLSFRQKGEKAPKQSVILKTLSEKYGLSPSTISGSITEVRAYRKNAMKDKEAVLE